MKSHLSLVALMVAGLSLFPGCGETAKAPEKKSGLVVINVLDKDTYEDCHIVGSINIPFDSIDAALNTIEKDAEVVFYCSNPMCSASGYAATQFQKAGFANVSVYEGGTAEWYQKGLPVEGASCSDYLRQSVAHVETEEGAVRVISAEELAKKMGLELPVVAAINEEVDVVDLGGHCMNEQLATIEIPVQK
jgi:rhodanese-related sulfurtransferase